MTSSSSSAESFLPPLLSPSTYLHHLLPTQYPSSVTASYASYAVPQFLSATASSTLMVLSTHSLLLCLYPSTPTLAPAAAALNWVIKDGLGMLGGIILNSKLGQIKGLDSNPKLYRLISGGLLDASFYLDLCSPKFPGLFLPIACVSNMFKNVSWLTASASRASIHNNLSLKANLADVTAKSGSQSVAASIIGTMGGVGMGMWFGGNWEVTIGVAVGLSVVHQGGNWWSLRRLGVRNFNRERLGRVCDVYFDKNVVEDPEGIKHLEAFEPWAKKWESNIRPGVNIQEMGWGEDDVEEWRKNGGEYRIVDDKIVFLESAENEDVVKAFLVARGEEVGRKIGVEEAGKFIDDVKRQGWRMGEGEVSVESEGGWRVRIEE
ncbi:hypothetical protein TL16_g01468 [Triparma laevis f. inornata]|uniref:Protein root UVB sensitive/RUS domain-containing protein n=1 Tax=Triparma laevis f. inornata TaxID=1714386 RepID=A0A9W7DRG5_9STRA|nr:hypothetical protein TL16_g01468 [Triparma laevis f. inornata]